MVKVITIFFLLFLNQKSQAENADFCEAKTPEEICRQPFNQTLQAHALTGEEKAKSAGKSKKEGRKKYGTRTRRRKKRNKRYPTTSFEWTENWHKEYKKYSYNITAGMLEGDFNKLFKVKTFVGGGSFGRVYQALRKKDNQTVTVKFLRQSFTNNITALKEGNILMSFDHPHIVKCLGMYGNKDYMQVIMQSHGDRTLGFHQFLNNVPYFDENFARYLFKQAAEAVFYVHSHNRAHMDIKDMNFIINERLQLQMIDFGFSEDLNTMQEPMTGTVGTTHFMAPEMNKGKRAFYGKRVDVWALGVMFYLSYFGHYPFPFDHDAYQILIPESQQCEPIRRTTYVFKDLLDRMLCPDDESRATIEEVLDHKWFRGSMDFKEDVYVLPFYVPRKKLNNYWRISYVTYSGHEFSKDRYPDDDD